MLRQALKLGAAPRALLATQAKAAARWDTLVQQGHDVNPCGSKFHPAATAGVLDANDAPTRSLQEAYCPASTCYGCGALRMRCAPRYDDCN